MKKLLIAIASLLLSSCAHTAKVTDLQDLPHLPTTVTGAVLPVRLDSEHSIRGQDGCILTLFRVEDGQTFDSDIPPGDEMLVIELPPGTYGFSEAYCGKITWDLTHHRFPRFLVQAGKISVLSGVQVYLSGARNMSLTESSRSGSRTDTLKFLGRLSEENRVRLISGYTGAAIPPPALEKPARWKNWELVDGAGKAVEKGHREWPSFKSCYRGEDEVNHLWLGNVVLDASYEDGSLTAAKPRDSWNTFSGQFLNCANAALKEFHPKAKTKLAYTIYL